MGASVCAYGGRPHGVPSGPTREQSADAGIDGDGMILQTDVPFAQPDERRISRLDRERRRPNGGSNQAEIKH